MASTTAASDEQEACDTAAVVSRGAPARAFAEPAGIACIAGIRSSHLHFLAALRLYSDTLNINANFSRWQATIPAIPTIPASVSGRGTGTFPPLFRGWSVGEQRPPTRCGGPGPFFVGFRGTLSVSVLDPRNPRSDAPLPHPTLGQGQRRRCGPAVSARDQAVESRNVPPMCRSGRECAR